MNAPMKISDLIAHLEEVRRQYGEVVVVPVAYLTPAQCQTLNLVAGAAVPGQLVVQTPSQPPPQSRGGVTGAAGGGGGVAGGYKQARGAFPLEKEEEEEDGETLVE
jgi:hypothetical protein